MSSYLPAWRPATRMVQFRTPRRAPAFFSRPHQSSITFPRALHGDAASATTGAGPVEPPDYLSEGERKIFDMIKDGLQPLKLEVQDISGGCGSMYALDIVSEQFKGLPVIKQHRLVNKVLGEEMKQWHGVQMKTKAPAEG